MSSENSNFLWSPTMVMISVCDCLLNGIKLEFLKRLVSNKLQRRPNEGLTNVSTAHVLFQNIIWCIYVYVLQYVILCTYPLHLKYLTNIILMEEKKRGNVKLANSGIVMYQNIDFVISRYVKKKHIKHNCLWSKSKQIHVPTPFETAYKGKA